MANSQTTFVLITGAWHPPSCYEPFAKLFRDAGYQFVCKKHPSVGPDTPVTSAKPDIELAHQTIEEEADKGQNVVVFMHSYGGFVGTEACKGLDKPTREAAGKKGGVVKLIYCAAAMLMEGQDLPTAVSPPENPHVVASPDFSRIDIIPERAHAVFYNDMTPEAAEKVARTLEYHSGATFLSKQTYGAYQHIPSLYVYCTLDQAILIEAQTAMVEAATKAGAHVDTVSLEASHSPFLSMPEKLFDVCVAAAA